MPLSATRQTGQRCQRQVLRRAGKLTVTCTSFHPLVRNTLRGFSLGRPIVLAPINDMLALAITEGIEDGLSVRDALIEIEGTRR
jgi:hypothetical protein